MSKFIPVLAYHSFDPVRFPKNKLAIKPRLFRCQMERIRSGGYRGIPIAECARRKWVAGFFEKAVALTFDDGYLDNYQAAFPVLCELKLPGTFFVTSGMVGEKGFMTWEMLTDMSRVSGIEIGSHGLFHKPLADLPESEARRSVFDSKKAIEDRLGRPVKAFSYPSGSFNDRVVELVREAGYEYACAASHVHDRRYVGNPFLIRRIKISSSSEAPVAFAWRLSGYYHRFGRP
jgi:peptidoglycan/xylan/chitin deacetylase (PgdA/CDA1 family)